LLHLLAHVSLLQVKIGDFGLTRMLPPGQEYWRLDKAGRLPVKYMAIETLTLKRFGIESDVWAFG
jgi:serine/threonine protein kinase